MATSLPAISPRRGGNDKKGSSKRQTGGVYSHSSFERTPFDAGSANLGRPGVEEWTPHDVAEWLFTQSTKDDYTHTFLVHNIDGPALLGLTREQLADWKVKLVDISAILKGVTDLRRISGGSIGWQPGSDEIALVPHHPSEPKPVKSARKKALASKGTPTRADATDTSATAPAADGDGGQVAAPGEDWSMTAVPGATTQRSRAPAEPERPSALSLGDSAHLHGHQHSSSPRVAGASPTYLKKVMGELHNSERVPLWKEEMVERVKRAATARQQVAIHQELAATSGPRSARLSHGGSTRRGLAADDDASSVVSSRKGGATNNAPSVVDSAAESGLSGPRSQQAKEIERKLFWYQDAIHEQELQQQLLDQKIRALHDEESAALEKRKQEPLLYAVGAIGAAKEQTKRQMSEQKRLSRALQVSEERVADAERFNRETMASINKLRRGRADFLRQLCKMDERVTAMTADMKHFSQAAHASLDEKEKVEARFKRQQFDYRNELSHTEHLKEMLEGELQALEEKIANGHAAEEAHLQAERQDAFRAVKQQREEEQRRELRLGFLQNHVRGQEMDFQRLHRIMSVKFTPEKPETVHEIIKASLAHEQRNSSLLHFVGVQNAEIEEIEERLRALHKLEGALEVEQAEAHEAEVSSKAEAEVEERLLTSTNMGIDKLDDDMRRLCPLVLKLWEMVQAAGAGGGGGGVQGGILTLKGCRPDTLTDFLRLIDVAIRELHLRASSLPTAAGNEWLRDFLLPKTVSSHPTVTELRKELEAAAQKQKEQKEAKSQETNGQEDTAAGSTFTFQPPDARSPAGDQDLPDLA